jgi:hypothetical protein
MKIAYGPRHDNLEGRGWTRNEHTFDGLYGIIVLFDHFTIGRS